MNPSQIIAHKRDGGTLSAEDIQAFILAYSRGDVAEYQMAAMAMAIYLRGMTTQETVALTLAKLHSGVTLSWPAGPAVVDKHSTGGIGDKVSLILAPLLACCGLRVPMISGRGLGATGGTLDKLESIAGFRSDLSTAEMQRVVSEIGCVISGATPELVPADRKLYALRDVTATVPSIPLITASILSKKLAEGLDALVLDVKFGTGAFMKSLEDAQLLAKTLVNVGRELGLPTTALLTDMNQPLGRMAGNAMEVEESLAVLSGRGPKDVLELTLELAAELLLMVGVTEDRAHARQDLTEQISSGAALRKFREMVEAQGGDLDRPRAIASRNEIRATRSGYIQAVNAQAIGEVIIELGGGRRKIGDKIDHAVGVEMLVRVGDRVERGQPTMATFASPEAALKFQGRLESAVEIDEQPCAPLPLIVERISS